MKLAAYFLSTLLCSTIVTSQEQDAPNLIVIMTDEHNLRTIGAYRDLMSNEQAFPWGEGVKVDTPHIDSLAKEGVLFNNFYAVTPLCTPSRASFMTGVYPKFTGSSWKNHGKLRKKRKTFAKAIISSSDQYKSAYLGKWHLNGKSLSTSDFGDPNRKFGFQNIDYQYNRGHWKYFEETATNLTAYEWDARQKFTSNGRNEEDFYATDFLFQKAIDFMDQKSQSGKKFAVMLSIADPHDPNFVREPYGSMFSNLQFQLPKTAEMARARKPGIPEWAYLGEGSMLTDSSGSSRDIDSNLNFALQQTFGMIKLIDDSLGKMLDFLESRGIQDDTLIVFTSDHGDQMLEHGRINKGVPYKTSAQVPFIIRWSAKIQPGKVVETPYTSVDFLPTILGLMGIPTQSTTHGIDASSEILGDQMISKNDNQIRFLTDSKGRDWMAAITNRYKLVLSAYSPWLFDMEVDPDEILNFYDDPNYADVVAMLQGPLIEASKKYKFSINKKSFIANTPSCKDSIDEIENWQGKVCNDVSSSEFSGACQVWDFVQNSCPKTCGQCCSDSEGEIWLFKALRTCADMTSDVRFCRQETAQLFCPKACGLCPQ